MRLYIPELLRYFTKDKLNNSFTRNEFFHFCLMMVKGFYNVS